MNRKIRIPIDSNKFYGNSLDGLYNDIEKRIEKTRKELPAESKYKSRSLLQPSWYKEEFWKQNEALANANENSDDDDVLCTFVFQDEQRRRFIVTYPEDFWEESEQISGERRVFYEVIPENYPCFLYYDIEFETDLNREKNGIKMTNTLIEITNEYINKYWSYNCDKSMIINLDSSRSGKFSKHLIFSTKNIAFKNNFEAGTLVKIICSDIMSFISSENTSNNILNKFNRADLEELLVETNKGKKLFIDLNVYTKNRHFRIYKATKWGKNSHLLHASDCTCNWNTKSTKSNDLDIFINSLISYLPKKKKLKLLSFDENKISQIQPFNQNTKVCGKQYVISKVYPDSSLEALNKFISDLVKPGRVREMKQIDNNHVIFEIVGNRYCKNIGRWHKSNNIYYIVDLNNKVIYQKCHDEDCNNFVSTPKKLPMKVTFYFEDETDSLLSSLKD